MKYALSARDLLAVRAVHWWEGSRRTRAMDDLDDATKIKIWDILHVFSPVQSLCRCYGNFTVGIHIEDILDMSNNEVNINGAVISVNQCSDHFFGIPIHEKKCECDTLQNCQVILPRWAWETVIRDNSDILLAGALWDGEKISVMHEQAAIIPLLKHSWSKLDINEDRRSVTCFEMFSGGFGHRNTESAVMNGTINMKDLHRLFSTRQWRTCGGYL